MRGAAAAGVRGEGAAVGLDRGLSEADRKLYKGVLLRVGTLCYATLHLGRPWLVCAAGWLGPLLAHHTARLSLCSHDRMGPLLLLLMLVPPPLPRPAARCCL